MINLLARALLTAVLMLGVILPAAAQPMNPVTAADIERALGYVPASSSATINSGTGGNIGYYASTGTAISGASKLSATTGGLGIVSGTQTTSQPVVAGTQTWNDASVLFKAITLSVTDTNSDGASKFLEFLKGGSNVFAVNKYGTISLGSLPLAIGQSYGGISFFGHGAPSMDDSPAWLLGGTSLKASKNACYIWGDDANGIAAPNVGGICQYNDFIISLTGGGGAQAGSALEMIGITAPGTPPSGSVYLYVDVADGKLKAKGASATVTALAVP